MGGHRRRPVSVSHSRTSPPVTLGGWLPVAKVRPSGLKVKAKNLPSRAVDRGPADRPARRWIGEQDDFAIPRSTPHPGSNADVRSKIRSKQPIIPHQRRRRCLDTCPRTPCQAPLPRQPARRLEEPPTATAIDQGPRERVCRRDGGCRLWEAAILSLDPLPHRGSERTHSYRPVDDLQPACNSVRRLGPCAGRSACRSSLTDLGGDATTERDADLSQFDQRSTVGIDHHVDPVRLGVDRVPGRDRTA